MKKIFNFFEIKKDLNELFKPFDITKKKFIYFLGKQFNISHKI